MRLILEDGSVFYGTAFGAGESVAGEVVFNTSMSGYVQALTDPSYRGQILVLTYPLVGNYGVPPARKADSLDDAYESGGIQVQGLIVQHYVSKYSHHAATRSLGQWLKEERIPAITGIDTRALTKRLRASGTMEGRLLTESDSKVNDPIRRTDMKEDVFRQVAPSKTRTYGEGDVDILLIDVGAKDNIVRSLVNRGASVTRVPWYDGLAEYVRNTDGVVIGNGPGNPEHLGTLIRQLTTIIRDFEFPILGICLGHQLLARAAGAETIKLPYGHRGINQPVQDLITRRSFITSQNHGYAVKEDSIPAGWEPWFININDGSNEGIRSLTKPHFGVQFHPEARPGPEDTAYLFDEFLSAVRARR